MSLAYPRREGRDCLNGRFPLPVPENSAALSEPLSRAPLSIIPLTGGSLRGVLAVRFHGKASRVTRVLHTTHIAMY